MKDKDTMSQVHRYMRSVSVGVIVFCLMSCGSSVRYFDATLDQQGFGPFKLVRGNSLAQIYSSEIEVPVSGALIGKPRIATFLSPEPPSNEPGWLQRRFAIAKPWQDLPMAWPGLADVASVVRAAKDVAHREGVKLSGELEWWLVGVEPIRLAGSRPLEHLDPLMENGWTWGHCWLVSQDDLQRPVEIVVIYTGHLSKPGLITAEVENIEHSKISFAIIKDMRALDDILTELTRESKK